LTRGAAHSVSTSPFDPLLQSLPYPSACPRAWISKPLACLVRFITAASPSVGIQAAIHAPTKRRMRPIRRVLDETVLDWVEMRVVHVSRNVPIVAYRVLPIPPLPITGDRASPVGKHFTNAVLIARHRPEKSASPRGKVHRQCI
jgi:hypothetical protein